MTTGAVFQKKKVLHRAFKQQRIGMPLAHLFAHHVHSFDCSALLTLLARSTKTTCSLAHALRYAHSFAHLITNMEHLAGCCLACKRWGGPTWGSKTQEATALGSTPSLPLQSSLSFLTTTTFPPSAIFNNKCSFLIECAQERVQFGTQNDSIS